MRKKLDLFYVLLQILLSFLLVFWKFGKLSLLNIDMYLSFTLMIIGLLIILTSILQLSKNLSPFPSPKSNSDLVTSGLYAYLRHPIYTGILILLLGYSLWQMYFSCFLFLLLLGILFYYKAKYEESLLLQKFKSYKEYQEKTKMLFPYLV